ncbi:MAG: hypothetical protein MET45_14560 [Nostoc sp. LLA-1]|nr:hypothetical protein [Cyanocohniella sp. LLY]
MLNNIAKFLPARQLRLPILGLLLTIGVVGVQTKPLLRNQTQTAYASTALAANHSQASVLPRLRQVREQRSLLRRIAVDTQHQENIPQTTTSNTSANQSSVRSQGRYKLVSSANLSKSVKTTPQAPDLVDKQVAVNTTGASSRANFPTQDGIYLYGQSPRANQLGQGYVIFQQRQGRVTGALYMPQSEFSCFQGKIGQSGELAMTVTGSPGEVGSNQVATANQLQVPDFSDDQMITYAHSVALQDYHQLKSISNNDRRILQMCTEFATGVDNQLVK